MRRPRTSVTWPGSSFAPRRNRTRGLLPAAERRQTRASRAARRVAPARGRRGRPRRRARPDPRPIRPPRGRSAPVPLGRGPRTRRGRSCRRPHRARAARARRRGATRPLFLVGFDRRADLEHLAAPARIEAFCSGALRDCFELGARLLVVLGASVVVRERQALVLNRQADGVSEARDPPGELRGALVELEPVVSDVADAFDPDHGRRLGAGAAADAGDEQVGSRRGARARPSSRPGRVRGSASPRSARACRRRRRGARSAGATRGAEPADPSH